MTERIQRQRQAGHRHPLGTLHASRPSVWGNPFLTAAAFRTWLETGVVNWDLVHPGILKGPNLWVGVAIQPGDTDWFDRRRVWVMSHLDQVRDSTCVSCWCPLDASCHVDILIDLAQPAE